MMKSDVVTIQSPDDREAIRRIGRLLRDGAIVALPTETVYGLAAKAEKEVVDRLDRLKGRPADKRYTLHIGRCEELTLYVPRPSLQARKLMHHFWPGPLTIVFELDKKYVEISRQKLEQVKPNFKIGEIWVSFYLRDIATVRNNDWNNLQQYFNIPNPARSIDFQKTTLKKGIVIPNDFECHTEAEKGVAIEQTKEEIIPLSPTKVPDYSESKSKVVAYVATKSINKTENIEV